MVLSTYCGMDSQLFRENIIFFPWWINVGSVLRLVYCSFSILLLITDVLHAPAGTFDYVFYKPNPLMQLFYLSLIIGGFTIFLIYGFELIPNPRLGAQHRVLAFFSLGVTLLTFFVASFASPGYVTKENYEQLEIIYPYDNFIFVKRECTTCHTPRVARSKHCRMQNRCVEKYDHFCPWINNTVGCFNFRYFLLFVFTTAAFLAYATYVFWQLIVFIIERDGLWNVKFLHPTTKQVVNADLFIIIQYLMTSQGPLVFMFVLCLVMALTVTLFFLFQLWLILDGTTSNESTKWGLVKDFYQSKKWKAELEKRSKDFPEDETLLQEHQDSLDERLTKHFPSKMPSNSYDRGSFWRNFKEVLFPHEFREQLYQQNYGRVKRLSDQTSKAPQEVEDSQTHSNTKLVSKQKRKKGH